MPGALTEIRGEGQPPPHSHTHENFLSLVVDEGNKKVRRLPSLYFWNTLVHADRDISKVRFVLEQTVAAVAQASTRPTYRFAACRIGGKYGLWGRDFYNRSSFRRQAARQGVEFADDPFVVFYPHQGFESGDFGSFEPEFAVLANHGEKDVLITTGAKLALILGSYRFGLLGGPELRALVESFQGKVGYSSTNAANLVGAIKEA